MTTQPEVFLVEDLYEDENFSVARVTLEGLGKLVKNNISDMTYILLEGEGEFRVNGSVNRINKGQSLTISKGTLYQDEGNMVMLAIAIPPFDPASVDIIES